MIDEVRHSTIQQNLKRLYMNNYIDPAGFNNSLRNFHNDYCGTIGRQFAEGFITGDAITAASIYLTIVAETAFTNTLFVAMPAEAAANGDYLLPTVFHSVQSDESRHISNGYATLLMALSDESNHQLLERDLRYAWWNNHRGRRRHRDVHRVRHQGPSQGPRELRRDVAAVDLRRLLPQLSGSAGEVRPGDPARPHRGGLEPDLEQGLRTRGGAVLLHRVAGQLLAYGPDDRRGLRVVRVQVPRLVRQVRQVVGELRTALHSQWHNPIVFEDVDYQYPHRCWTMVPCLVREDMVMAEVDGQMRTYCHEACRWTDVEAFRPTFQGRETPNMGQLIGKREWETLYHGWNWADVVSDMGCVRDDGKTMTAQPHLNLDPKKMWTLDHLRRCRRRRAPTCCSTR